MVDSTLTCKGCIDGYYLNANSCVARTITSNCTAPYPLEEDKCGNCVKGFFLDTTDGTPATNKTCKDPTTVNADCSYFDYVTDKCIKCKSSYYHYHNHNGGWSDECKDQNHGDFTDEGVEEKPPKFGYGFLDKCRINHECLPDYLNNVNP